MEPTDTNGQSEEEQMQYGAWLRGEPGRRGLIEMEKQSNGLIKLKVATGGEADKMMKTSEPAKMLEKTCEKGICGDGDRLGGRNKNSREINLQAILPICKGLA